MVFLEALFLLEEIKDVIWLSDCDGFPLCFFNKC